MGVRSVESALTSVLIDRGGPGVVAVVRWVVTGEHVVTDGGFALDRGWPLPGPPDLWVV